MSKELDDMIAKAKEDHAAGRTLPFPREEISMTQETKPLTWPERLTLRDTKVYADEGQRIFTTATGYGYEKREYVRIDGYEALAATIRAKEERIAALEAYGVEMLHRKDAQFERAEAAEAKLSKAVEALKEARHKMWEYGFSEDDLQPIRATLKEVGGGDE